MFFNVEHNKPPLYGKNKSRKKREVVKSVGFFLEKGITKATGVSAKPQFSEKGPLPLLAGRDIAFF
ncbi:MAG: hypothetical protein J5817_04295 [Treponema sp.]|nr:hypothetical protein [Treponema sp.]